MARVLFVGSFLSQKTGTYSVTENLARLLRSSEINLFLTSNKKNKILRLLEIIVICLFHAYDKIHIDTFSGQAFRISEIASYIGIWRRKNIILTLHGGKLPEFFCEEPERVKRVFNRANRIQTPSIYLKNFFAAQRISVNYLPNSIDLSHFPYSRENVKPHSLLWVRAFTEIYNPDLAVRILYEVRKIFPDAILTMVGPDKGFLSKTRSLINKLDLNASVTITGSVPNEQLYTYYQSHEVFLNTTSYESFGVAVLEAAACGIPVVSSKVGEIPYLWKNGVDIFMVEEYEPVKYADAIVKLFTNKDLEKTLSANARKKAEGFDWYSIKGEWLKLLS